MEFLPTSPNMPQNCYKTADFPGFYTKKPKKLPEPKHKKNAEIKNDVLIS